MEEGHYDWRTDGQWKEVFQTYRGIDKQVSLWCLRGARRLGANLPADRRRWNLWRRLD